MSLGTWHRARGAVELIHNRSAYVKVDPTPTSLSERRAVLHAMQRFGKVDVFKRLPSTSSFICAFQTTRELTEALKRSPLSFKYVSEALEATQSNADPGVTSVSVAAPIEIHFAENEKETDKPTLPKRRSDPVKTFKVWLEHSGTSYSHKTTIRRNPLHGRWPAAQKQDQDFVYNALRQVVPENIAQNGLCDWVTGGQLSEDAKLAREDEEVAMDWQVAERIQRRRAREALASDEHELVSWDSIIAAPKPAEQAAEDAFEGAFVSAFPAEGLGKKTGQQAIGEAVFGKDSETISEALQPRDQFSHTDQEEVSQVEASRSNITSQSDRSHDAPNSKAGSTSNKVLQKILAMSDSSPAAPSLTLTPAEPSSNLSNELLTEPSAGLSSAPSSAPSAKSSAESSAKPSAKLPAEPPMEPSTKLSTEPVSAPCVEPSTAAPTESSAEHSAEPSADSVSESSQSESNDQSAHSEPTPDPKRQA